MTVKIIDSKNLAKTLGRHSKIAIPFRFTYNGNAVDFQQDSYTVEVYVRDSDGATISGPFPTTLDGITATYFMSDADLANASDGASGQVYFVAVAENDTYRLVSDALKVTVGDYPGADLVA